MRVVATPSPPSSFMSCVSEDLEPISPSCRRLIKLLPQKNEPYVNRVLPESLERYGFMRALAQRRERYPHVPVRVPCARSRGYDWSHQSKTSRDPCPYIFFRTGISRPTRQSRAPSLFRDRKRA